MKCRDVCIAIYFLVIGLMLGRFLLLDVKYIHQIDPACEWALKVTHFFEGNPNNEDLK